MPGGRPSVPPSAAPVPQAPGIIVLLPHLRQGRVLGIRRNKDQSQCPADQGFTVPGLVSLSRQEYSDSSGRHVRYRMRISSVSGTTNDRPGSARAILGGDLVMVDMVLQRSGRLGIMIDISPGAVRITSDSMLKSIAETVPLPVRVRPEPVSLRIAEGTLSLALRAEGPLDQQ